MHADTQSRGGSSILLHSVPGAFWPVPVHRGRLVKQTHYPTGYIEVGQWFTVPCTPDNGTAKLREVRVDMIRAQLETGKRFEVRVSEGKEIVVFCAGSIDKAG